MSHPVVEAKLERAAESIEALANAVYTLREKADDDRIVAMKDVADAREEMKTALRQFIQPALRLA